MTDRQTETVKEVKPQYYAQKCPVCSGFGTVSFKKVACHACYGRGYILIPIEKEREKYGIPV